MPWQTSDTRWKRALWKSFVKITRLTEKLINLPRGEIPREFRECIEKFQVFLIRGRQELEGIQPSSSSPVVYVPNITSISPTSGCPGETMTISGSNFGEIDLSRLRRVLSNPTSIFDEVIHPPDIALILPSQEKRDIKKGRPLILSCRVFEDIPEWSNTEIQFTIPPWMGSGCIGFVNLRLKEQWEEFVERVRDFLNQFMGLIIECLPPKYRKILGSNVIYEWGEIIQPPNLCPECTGTNRFRLDLPVIESFSINGLSEAYVYPGEKVTFSWKVTNASSICIELTSVAAFAYNFSIEGSVFDPHIVIQPTHFF